MNHTHHHSDIKTANTPVLNFATYRFVALEDPLLVRDWLREVSLKHHVRGTILLAHEGINLFVAALESDARAWLEEVETDERFSHLGAKESWSASIPYRKLVCKVRPEIIRMNEPGIVQMNGRAPAVDAITLKRWLDAGVDDNGTPVVMLDTRNQFEVDMGTFDDAISWNIQRFTEFPQATNAHAPDLKDKTVVSFCTGGIRCEKAAIYLRQAGVNALQLEGGILKYFEQTGGAHYTGNCFVFDDRAILDTSLKQVGDYPPDTQFNPKLYNKTTVTTNNN
jgi:UPF0176 protein